MLFVGGITSREMGTIADSYVHQELVGKAQTVAALQEVAAAYPALAATLADDAVRKKEVDDSVIAVRRT